MIESMTHAVKLSELREKINGHDGEDTDALAALENESKATEVKYRSAVKAEAAAAEVAAADGSGAEHRALVEGASVGRIFAAALEGRATDGREHELQTAAGLGSNQVPLALIENRAITPAPGDTGATQQPIVQPVFSEGDAMFLGVMQERVAVGDAVFPVLTSRPTVEGPHTDDSIVAAPVGSFSAFALSPGRLQASFEYLRTDAARFFSMDESLRMALSSGLSEALDKEVVDQIVTDVTRTDASAADTFATYRSRFVYASVDGRFASTEQDVRLLVGSKTLENMSGLYRGNSADDSAVDSLRRVTGGVKVSPHIAMADGNKKQDVIVRRGMRPDAVAAIWDGVTLIPDSITKAGAGTVILTAVGLASFKVTRTDGFARIQSQHA